MASHLEKCGCGGEMEEKFIERSLSWLRCKKCNKVWPYITIPQMYKAWNARQRAIRMVEEGWKSAQVYRDEEVVDCIPWEPETFEILLRLLQNSAAVEKERDN